VSGAGQRNGCLTKKKATANRKQKFFNTEKEEGRCSGPERWNGLLQRKRDRLKTGTQRRRDKIAEWKEKFIEGNEAILHLLGRGGGVGVKGKLGPGEALRNDSFHFGGGGKPWSKSREVGFAYEMAKNAIYTEPL